MYSRFPSKTGHTSFMTTTELQNELIAIMNPLSPYNSMLYSLQVGQGKTYAAASLAYQYTVNGFYVLYASHTVASTTNFRRECSSFVNDQRITNMNLNEIDCFTFSKLYNYINKNKITKQYGLIILDEAHNLRDKKVRYSLIKKYIESLQNTKLLLITATPMINETNELDILTGFMKYNKFTDDKIHTIYSDVPSSSVKVEYQGVKTEMGTLYITEMKNKQKACYNESALKEYNTFNSNLRQISICSFNERGSELDITSCKFDAIMSKLKEGELSIVFSFYKEKSAVLFALYLEKSGLFTKYVPSESAPDAEEDLSMFDEDDLLLLNRMKQLSLDNKTSKRKYAIVTGSTPSDVNDKVLNRYSSLENKDGKVIEVLIGTNVISESISLRELRHVHIIHPFWNYGVIKQMIGRALRLNSYRNPDETVLKVYLHASIICENIDFELALKQLSEGNYNNIVSDDLATWKVAWKKTDAIDTKLQSILNNKQVEIESTTKLVHPTIDNVLVLYNRLDNSVYDLRECFDKSVSNISRMKFMQENAVKYDLNRNKKIYSSIPEDMILFEPPEGISMWVSCVDGMERLTIKSNNKDKRHNKRGKIFNNMTQSEIKLVSESLNTTPTLKVIRAKLVELNRYYPKQVYIKYDKRH